MWLVLALLTFLAVSFVIYPLIKTASKPAADEIYGAEGVIKRANVDLFKEQLAALDKQLFDGDIDDVQYAELVAEQKRLLLADASQSESSNEETNNDLTTAIATEKSQSGRGAWLVMACMLLVPLLAFSLYQKLGANDDIEIAELLERRAGVANPEANANEDYVSLGKKIQRKLSRRLQSKPNHLFYRVTLARLQMEDNDFEAARASYQEALHWSPDDADLAAEYAQALYFVADSKFEGQSSLESTHIELNHLELNNALDRALFLNPSNKTALGLQGIRAFGAGDYALAAKSWQTALKGINPASPQAQALQSGILRAQKMLDDETLSGNTSGDKTLGDKALDEALPALAVKVSLSQELKADPNRSVYVFAREWQGRPMPLAVVKLSVADLPISVRLDDSMAMPGGETLSSVLSSDGAIQIVARVSSTGSAIPSEGDFEGVSGEIAGSDLVDGKKQEIPVLIDRKL